LESPCLLRGKTIVSPNRKARVHRWKSQNIPVRESLRSPQEKPKHPIGGKARVHRRESQSIPERESPHSPQGKPKHPRTGKPTFTAGKAKASPNGKAHVHRRKSQSIPERENPCLPKGKAIRIPERKSRHLPSSWHIPHRGPTSGARADAERIGKSIRAKRKIDFKRD
jgi:hypothetical protein